MSKKSVYRWMLAGSVLGGLGSFLAQSNSLGSKRLKRKMKSKAAKAARVVSSEAGDMLTMVGSSLSNRIR